ncbi:MAG: RNA recognition motif domain-containing protein, partial [Methylococcaceae bacterium]
MNYDCKLFIGNISEQVSQRDLEQLFSPHGTVHTATVILDLLDGRPRGFGFVIMDSPEEAHKARSALDDIYFKGQFLKIEEERPRTEGFRPPGRFWVRKPCGQR